MAPLTSDGLLPHGQCILWKPDLLWLHVLSDSLIASAYLAIPLILLSFVRKRRDVPFRGIFLLFGAFIVACGTTHLMEVWTLWRPSYWLSGWIKASTAVVSWATAIQLFPTLPKALALRSPAELETVNEALRQEIAERRRAEGEVRRLNQELERRVADRTAQLQAAVRDLEVQIGERARIEQALQEKNLELEAANRAKDRFLASMSHELRTPLNAIIGFTGTLLMKLPGPLTPDQGKQLHTIQASAKYLLSLINDLLDLAKIESGKVTLNPEPLVAQSVVQDVAAALRPLAEAKGLAYHLQVPVEALILHTDRRALSQILLNLVNNAIKFTDAGGVTLTLSRRIEWGAPITEFGVADTGVGIRPEDQARLFQAFVQLDREERRRTEGSGLGLYLSQRLAELLGGRILFESHPGRGSVFTLQLREG